MSRFDEVMEDLGKWMLLFFKICGVILALVIVVCGVVFGGFYLGVLVHDVFGTVATIIYSIVALAVVIAAIITLLIWSEDRL